VNAAMNFWFPKSAGKLSSGETTGERPSRGQLCLPDCYYILVFSPTERTTDLGQ
jgi:hypothetical protein